jgi:DNA polymerase-3 subunit beta
MKLAIERTVLTAALTRAARIVERRNTIPVLSNLLLTAGQDGLRIKATDLDIEIVETLAAQVDTPGEVTAPAHMLADIVRKMPDGCQISICSIGIGLLQVQAGRSRFKLQTLPASDFPDIATGDLPSHLTIPGKTLKAIVDRTQFAISTEETRYYLNGIYLHAAQPGARLRAVSTDGHRLAQAQMAEETAPPAMPGVIVPRKTVAEIGRLLAEAPADVQVDLSPQKIRFTIGAVTLTSKLIDGTFPDYGRVIPSANDKVLVVDKDALGKALDRVSTVSSERGRAVKLGLSDSRLTLTVTNPDSGDAVEEIDAEYEADAIEIGFNARYLLDILGQVAGDTVRVKLADPGSPALIEDPTDASALFVLMPMRV